MRLPDQKPSAILEYKERLDQISRHGWGRGQAVWSNAEKFGLVARGSVYPGEAVMSACAPLVWAVFNDLERVAYATSLRCRLCQADGAELDDKSLTEAFACTIYLRFGDRAGDLEWVAQQLTRLHRSRDGDEDCLVASVCFGLGAATKEHPTLTARKWLTKSGTQHNPRWVWEDLSELRDRFPVIGSPGN